MDRTNHIDIRIGTLAPFSKGTAYLKEIVDLGFESFQLNAWQYLGAVNLESYAAEALDIVNGKAIISSLGVYGNPLTDSQTRDDFESLIKAAHIFGATTVCGFTGAQEDRSVEENLPRFTEVWSHLAKVAEDAGVKIGFENCDMGGTWDQPRFNIAHSPRAWEMLFNEVPSDAIGLEWEPCHQLNSLVDPIPQLRKWVSKIVHLHGKDATVHWDVIKSVGIRGGLPMVHHRTPGFGDTNWTDVISILRMANWTGTIDIEGWHDPVYNNDLEMTGQVYGLNYLKACRGGSYFPTPAL